MDAEKVASILDAEKVIVFGSKNSFYKVSKELGEELWRLIDLITPFGNCFGYAVVNGETLVFRKGLETIIAFVDGDRIIGSLKRLSEND
ncbi:MAG: hypothetical protein N3D09_04930 [Archaeoglobaceae archaeon]|nr:hypothetical protein [Archaeoglobaceae archaeon]